jgi:hypothetical protein
MTCKPLRGACDKAFQTDRIEAIAEHSKQHGMAMHKAQGPAHLNAMHNMREPEATEKWFEEKILSWLPEY